PEGLRDVIGKRLSRLSPDCNRVLAVAAVIGRDFGLETLHAVVELDEEQVVSSLEEALHIGVLEEQSRPGSIRYRFAHAFFRQTLYEELIAPRRLRLHQQVAAALEKQYANRLEEHAAELAEHFSQSTDRVELTKAVKYGDLAAQRALAVYAYGEAVRHLEQALAVQEVLDPDDTSKRCDLLLALGEALVSGGESMRAMDVVAPEALRLAEALGDRGRASQACRIVWRTIGAATSWRQSEGERWAEAADRNADEETSDRVYADLFMFLSPRMSGDDRQAQALRNKAIHLALRLNDTPALVDSAQGLLGGSTVTPEEYGERLALAEELSHRSLDAIHSARLAQTLAALGCVYLTWGNREEAEQVWRRAIEAATRSRDASMALVPLSLDALVQTLDGRLQPLLSLGSQIRELGTELTLGESKLIAARAVRRALIYLGRADEALAGVPEVPEVFSVGGVYTGQRAVCLAHVGRTGEARELLHRMVTSRDVSRRDDSTSAATLGFMLEAAVVAQDRDVARALLPRMAPLADLLATEALMAFNIGRLCGGAAVLLGEMNKARGYYQQAIEICEKVRFRPELALTRLELAELLLAQADSRQLSAVSTPPAARGRGAGKLNADKLTADRSEALAHLDFAIAEFRDMKMQPSLERALRHKEVLKA
ncbi:MAG TPA: hypothetical protein VK821_10195, partial [Dehalococcoidia bacterium]|nr:hypothetical protein [Dehalococcoidia bacterium]